MITLRHKTGECKLSNILWGNLDENERNEYIGFLQIFGALSGLFKDNKEGANAKKPYLYYRNHEQLYARVFSVEDLTRKDSAFDALMRQDKGNIGIGLKTWIHTKDLTYQKVAEFNKLAPTELRPLVDHGTPEEVIKRVSELRNDRIMLDKRLYNTEHDIYHYITRDNNVMNIAETSYDLVQLDSLKLLKSDGKTYSFTDGKRKYRYYNSKSVMLEEFDASEKEIITQIPIVQFDDPFELIKMIELPSIAKSEETHEVIYLPIYSDASFKIEEKSAFNMQLGASKNKGSNKPRPAYEVYIPIPVWIHYVYKNFFGVNPFNPASIKASDGFWLELPNGNKVKARNTQQNGKSLQTNPQSVLGEWILRDVFGLAPYEKLTMQRLNEFGVDSFKITKINDQHFKIDLAETYAFEKWKLDIQEDIERAHLQASEKKWNKPKFRPEVFAEE